ncbi:MAG: hypothetical protein ISS57_05405 [Anaerolineales bacterium]|nr:hypothetical protein [Anaerolineales bacterium]
MPHILLATRNPWKARLFTPVFQHYGFDTLTLNDISPNGKPPAELGVTAIDNALAKARFYHSVDHPWVFGDDAGLEIEALGDEPGLQARRWGGHFPDDVDDQTWLEYLLERMRDVPPGKRAARFVAGWALIAPDGSENTREIQAPFEIATRVLRPISPGSPITAVRAGPPDDLARRQAEIRAEWERWGILSLHSYHQERL